MSHLMPLLTMKLKYMDKIKRKGKGLKRKGKTAKTGKKAKRNMMRENIKKWLSGGDVNEITLKAQQEEAERLRRVEERVALMKQQNQKYLLQNSQDDVKVLTSDDELIALCKSGYRGGVEFIDTNNDGAHTDDRFNQPDEQGRVLVNVGHDKNEPPLYLAPQLSRAVKPHQIGGIRFLYDNIVECFWKHLTGSAGLGCILAHSMGLGKTLQLISFIDVYLTHTQSKYVLCIVPINTLQNWMSQFDMWLPSKKVAAFRPNSSEMKFRQFDVFMLNDCKTLFSRAKEILAWRESGGVLLIGYEMYRLLTTDGKTAKGKKVKTEETEGLPKETYDRLMCLLKAALVDPGPDLVICDEGHRLKDAATSQALKNIRTRRRIVLTGHPFQKKPIEYWCMVDFVRPNFLGTRKEFRCNFGNAIFNGQRAYSTPGDKRVMEQRVAMLHKLIRGFVQRRCLLLDHEESKLSQYEKKIAEAIYFRQKQAMTQSAGPAPKNPMIANPNFLANVPTVPTIPGKPALGRPSLYPSAGIVPPPVRSRIQTPFNVREWKRSALFDSQSMPPESTPLLSNMISQSQNHASPSSSLSMPSTSSSKPELICLDDLDDICLI